MSNKHFEENCPGCKPVLADSKTFEPLPEDDPASKALAGVWEKTTLEERQSFHNVTCNNSRDEKDLEVMAKISAQLQQALKRTLN
jgi:hypothetical protein